VNKLIRASFSLHIVQISSQKENTEEIKNEQNDALNEIAKTKRKLLKMTAQGKNGTGIATFQMWWFQLTAGLQMQEDNLVWLEK
jgi:small-conductance mechanosensitive channel